MQSVIARRFTIPALSWPPNHPRKYTKSWKDCQSWNFGKNFGRFELLHLRTSQTPNPRWVSQKIKKRGKYYLLCVVFVVICELVVRVVIGGGWLEDLAVILLPSDIWFFQMLKKMSVCLSVCLSIRGARNTEIRAIRPFLSGIFLSISDLFSCFAIATLSALFVDAIAPQRS